MLRPPRLRPRAWFSEPLFAAGGRWWNRSSGWGCRDTSPGLQTPGPTPRLASSAQTACARFCIARSVPADRPSASPMRSTQSTPFTNLRLSCAGRPTSPHALAATPQSDSTARPLAPIANCTSHKSIKTNLLAKVNMSIHTLGRRVFANPASQFLIRWTTC